jgi:hypothetical protein
MEVRPHPLLKAGARWRVMTVLALMTASYAGVVLLAPNLRPPFLREPVGVMALAVYVHLAAGASALAVGAFQLIPRSARPG